MNFRIHLAGWILASVFALLTIEKHMLGDGLNFPQIIAIFLLVFCFLHSIFRTGFADPVGLILAIFSSMVSLSVFILSEYNAIANLANTFLILFTFTLAIQIANISYRNKVWRLGDFSLAVVLALTVIGGLQFGWNVSYLGDTRGARLVAGWEKPTFLAEALTLLVFFAVAMRQELGVTLLGIRSRIVFFLIITGLLSVIFLTGSRAALGASVIFLYWTWQENRSTNLRRTFKFSINLMAFFGIFWYSSYGFDLEALNAVTSGRWYMAAAEIETNLATPTHWLLGNFDSQMSFLKDEFGNNSVYHIDSFFVERLIVTGLLGLLLVALNIWRFYSLVGSVGKSIVVACVFYGIFENGVFNLTSMFSAISILIAAISSRRFQ